MAESRQERAVREALAAEDRDVERRTVAAATGPSSIAERPQSPVEVIAGGVLVALLGGLMIAVGANGVTWMIYAGTGVVALAWIPVTAGVIALGVRLGMRWHRHESDHR